MDEDKKKKIMIVVVILCLIASMALAYNYLVKSKDTGINSINKDRMVWVKCSNPDCGTGDKKQRASHKCTRYERQGALIGLRNARAAEVIESAAPSIRVRNPPEVKTPEDVRPQEPAQMSLVVDALADQNDHDDELQVRYEQILVHQGVECPERLNRDPSDK